jgi:NAD(P)H-dependent FMN reductase
LALLLQDQLQKTEHEVGIIDVREHELPPIQSVFTSVNATPVQFRPLAERMFEADAFILVSPEYNGSYTPALKNLLDHFPKQQHKPFGIATASPGALGGIRAAMQLQQLIFGLFGIGSPHMLITPGIDKKINEEGELIDDSFRKSVDNFIQEYLWLAEKIVEQKVTSEKIAA